MDIIAQQVTRAAGMLNLRVVSKRPVPGFARAAELLIAAGTELKQMAADAKAAAEQKKEPAP